MVDVSAMDLEVKAADDFYRFANGQWSKQHPIPSDHARWGIFHILRERVLLDLHHLLQSTSQPQLRAFWESAIRTQPNDDTLHTLLAHVDETAQDTEGLAKIIGWAHAQGIPLLYDMSIQPDLKDSTTERLFISQGGLGLPDRDYYLEDAKSEQRDIYQKHIASMLRLAFTDLDTEPIAEQIVELETRLAKISRSKTAMRDLVKLYNPFALEGLINEYPEAHLEALFISMELPMEDRSALVVNATPEFITCIATEMFKDISLETWRWYLKFHVMHFLAPMLSEPFVQQNFQLQQALTGVPELAPRWKRVIQRLNSCAGELLGQEYCRVHFKPEAKTQCAAMVERLRQALAETLETLPWMGPKTKQRAKDKLASLGLKIGYPDQWIDYSTLKWDAQNSYADNVLQALLFEHRRDMKERVNQPVQPHRWEMPPQTVNAYFHPMRNEIVFPAAILQSPAYDAERDEALNYGAIGAVIGHEITHGYDDQGRLFDEQGNMNEWWTPEDAERFESRAKQCIEQFAKQTILDGKHHVNGALTVGENIADIGGVKIAYKALQALYRDKGRPEPERDANGFTPEQRFFLGWAQFWASSAREQEAIRLLAVDPHSPSDLRAWCPLQHVPEFYEAFGISPGDPMFLSPEERVEIW